MLVRMSVVVFQVRKLCSLVHFGETLVTTHKINWQKQMDLFAKLAIRYTQQINITIIYWITLRLFFNAANKF